MNSKTKRSLIAYATVGLLFASTISSLIALCFSAAAAWTWTNTGRFVMPSLSTYWAPPQIGELQRVADWLWSSWILVPDALCFVTAFCLWGIILSITDRAAS